MHKQHTFEAIYIYFCYSIKLYESHLYIFSKFSIIWSFILTCLLSFLYVFSLSLLFFSFQELFSFFAPLAQSSFLRFIDNFELRNSRITFICKHVGVEGCPLSNWLINVIIRVYRVFSEKFFDSIFDAADSCWTSDQKDMIDIFRREIVIMQDSLNRFHHPVHDIFHDFIFEVIKRNFIFFVII